MKQLFSTVLSFGCHVPIKRFRISLTSLSLYYLLSLLSKQNKMLFSYVYSSCGVWCGVVWSPPILPV